MTPTDSFTEHLFKLLTLHGWDWISLDNPKKRIAGFYYGTVNENDSKYYSLVQKLTLNKNEIEHLKSCLKSIINQVEFANTQSMDKTPVYHSFKDDLSHNFSESMELIGSKEIASKGTKKGSLEMLSNHLTYEFNSVFEIDKLKPLERCNYILSCRMSKAQDDLGRRNVTINNIKYQHSLEYNEINLKELREYFKRHVTIERVNDLIQFLSIDSLDIILHHCLINIKPPFNSARNSIEDVSIESYKPFRDSGTTSYLFPEL
jgi:hypothetical protein